MRAPLPIRARRVERACRIHAVRLVRTAIASLALLAASLSPDASAQVVLDPTFSPATVGPGQYAPGQDTDYLIRESYGRRSGDNLFHRFSRFDIPTGESATFVQDAPGSGIRRIVAHVGGSGPSRIDGVLRSTIPNADLFFYNARGVVFGASARLDLMGSFHVSSADLLRFSDGVDFGDDVGGPATSITAADPAAWGFLSTAPAEIHVDGGSLTTPDQMDFSLVGGPIHIDGPGTSMSPNVGTSTGILSLVSVASAGDVPIVPGVAPDLDLFPALGPVTLGSGAVLDASGTDDQILIVRAGSLSLDDATITAHHRGAADHPGTAVDIAVRDSIRLGDFAAGTVGAFLSLASRDSPGTDVGKGGDVRFSADTFLADGLSTEVVVGTACNLGFACAPGAEPGGGGGAIEFDVDRFRVRNGAAVVSVNSGRGTGGTMSIRARRVEVGSDPGSGTFGLVTSFNNGFFDSSTTPPADQRARGGDIVIDATESVTLDNWGNIETQTFNNGRGGDVTIRTGDLRMIDTDSVALERSQIATQTDSTTLVDPASGEGRAGDITIDATGDISIEGGFIESKSKTPTGPIFANGLTGAIALRAPDGRISLGHRAVINSNLNAGIGAPITLEARSIDLDSGGLVQSIIKTTGRAGDIHLDAPTIRIRGRAANGSPSGLFSRPLLSSDSQPNGSSGSITIDGDHLIVADGGTINVTGNLDGGAGSVLIGDRAPLVSVLVDDATIEANTLGLGATGGDIEINAQRIRLDNGARLEASNRLTGGTGSIRLNGSELEMLGGSEIAATSGAAGVGGNITIRMSDRFLANDARITTDSQGSTPTNQGGDIDIEARVIVLSETALRATAPAGAGGRIQIVAGRFFPAAANPPPVATGGTTAQNGTVSILSSDTNTASAVPRPAVAYEDAGRQLASGCESRTEAQGSLYVLPRPVETPPGENLGEDDAVASEANPAGDSPDGARDCGRTS